MSKLPKKLEKVIEENEALIKEKLGEAFYNRIAIGDITYLDVGKIQQIIRAAALEQ